uniref:Uncharacterized protein n=1 Tax=Anguilla anguilla TaxID=7936 RepID=A0A0E9R347_ANGAN
MQAAILRTVCMLTAELWRVVSLQTKAF